MRNTPIQWTHSTINPVMGCDGCELWPSKAGLLRNLKRPILACANPPPEPEISTALAIAAGDFTTTSEIHAARKRIAADVVVRLQLPATAVKLLEDEIRKSCKCYAGLLGTMRPAHKGYADRFESPKLFPGRMATAARWAPPAAPENEAKPWLVGAPRMIFISDMGDALSGNVPFDYLRDEIIGAVNFIEGSRHIWLWLTKRPARMAAFGQWLDRQNIRWPDNLVAMTTVTSHATRGRVDELRKVPAKFRGLSCEPIYSELDLDLTGIDWLIAGGGSDIFAEPFHVEWALQLRDRCRHSRTALFLKQLGRNPFFNGQPLQLRDPHGGEWDEWPDPAWRVREIPAGFKTDFDARANGAT
jgi:protein gp37